MRSTARRLVRAVTAVAILGGSVVAADAAGVTSVVPHAYACVGNHMVAYDHSAYYPQVELYFNDCSHWTYVKEYMQSSDTGTYWGNVYLQTNGNGNSGNNVDSNSGYVSASQPLYTRGKTIQCGVAYRGFAVANAPNGGLQNWTNNVTLC